MLKIRVSLHLITPPTCLGILLTAAVGGRGAETAKTTPKCRRTNGTEPQWQKARRGRNEGAGKRMEGAGAQNRTAAKQKRGEAETSTRKKKAPAHERVVARFFHFHFLYIEYASQQAQV